MASDPQTTAQSVTQDSDVLLEISAVKLRKFLNAKLDRWALIFGTDPRDSIAQEEILSRFADEYPLSETGHYYITPDVIDRFCERICELAVERVLNRLYRKPKG